MRIAEQTINGLVYRDMTSDEVGQEEPPKRATKQLAKGEYFYLDGQLCKAKTPIANGAILTLNTNYQVTSMEDELSLLNQ